MLVLMASCEIFPDHNNKGQLQLPQQPPVLDFSYVNSTSFPGWIRFSNHSTSMVSYKWYFGFNDESGKEATSFSSAPKVKYPSNGTFRVIVEGIDIYDKMHSLAISVDVTNN